jgi:hypothetical protein
VYCSSLEVASFRSLFLLDSNWSPTRAYSFICPFRKDKFSLIGLRNSAYICCDFSLLSIALLMLTSFS